MIAFVITILSFFHQVDMVQMTLVNPSNQTIHLHIENFNDVTIGAKSESQIAMVVGEKIYGKKRIELTEDEWEQAELITIEASDQGSELNIYKLYKKAFKR